jgi:hypothetical protein
MNTELSGYLQYKARELCAFYNYLALLDRGILLSLIAKMSEDDKQAKNFVKKLKTKKRYQKFIKNPSTGSKIPNFHDR